MNRDRLALILFKGKTLSGGERPVMLQYYINGRTRRRTIAKVLPEDWDEKAKRLKGRARNAAIINSHIAQEFARAEHDLYKLKMGELDASDILDKKTEVTLSKAFDLELERYKSGNMASTYRRVASYKTMVASMTNIDILLKQIDLKWFEKLNSLLKQKGHTGGTDAKIIYTVRAIIARHIDGALPENIRAFKVLASKSVKAKLTREEVAKIEKLQLEPDTYLSISRDIFLLQIYLRGIRIGDILQARCSQFKEGRFSYTANKTGKEFSIAIISQAQTIIDRYAGNGEYLFPLFKWSYNSKRTKFDNELYRVAEKSTCTTIVNKHLKIIAEKCGIAKSITTHIARHTFARMAIDKVNNPMVSMELLGHSSLAVHQQYLKDLRNDEALDKVAGEIFN